MKKIFILLFTACVLAACINTPSESDTQPVQPPSESGEPTESIHPSPELSESPEPSSSPKPSITPEPSNPPEPTHPPDPVQPPHTSPESFVWEVSTPQDHGLNPHVLSDIYSYIKKDKRINSFLIIKNKYIIAEKYYNDHNQNSLHNTYSCTKSVTSALIGIAIENKYITLNQPILDFFPEYTFKSVTPWKSLITIEHLLTMTSGLQFDELSIPYTDPDNPFIQMIYSDDWIQFILDNPVIYYPGSTFNYSSGNSHVLSGILHNATGTDTLSFAAQYLFEPLGISKDDVHWETDPQGIYVGGSWLHLTSRDMAKFGLLYLNEGTWGTTQVVPSHWVKTSTQPVVHIEEYADYGYHWWVDKNMYFAEGYKGQFICVIPKMDLVVVLTANIPQSDVSTVFNDVMEYIFLLEST
ncbi:MAG: serine hydrolase [Candidatus Methanofastidiosia archaeon]|jgi:CubicO group peptidase (beta-lactamase class C family)